jgi:hypothetical protein
MGHRIRRETLVNIHFDQGISRRDLLRWLPAVGLSAGIPWDDLVASESDRLRRQGKACILLWMQGGPSQFETFSPVPGHPHGGETKAISTSVPGIQIAENLPEVARQMHDLCIVRSMVSKEGSHPRASYLLHTGYLPNPSVRYPAFGANVAHQIAAAASDLPSFVRIGGAGRDGSAGGLLGVDFDPFLLRDARRPPENTAIRTDRDRHERRLALAESMNRRLDQRGAERESHNHQKLYERATRMILSREMSAFDLSREPDRIRAAYGESPFAGGCLLARRLVEHGVTFVEVSLGNWDTHQDNFAQSRQLCEQLDRPFAQLLRELKERHLLDSTLVVWMGEFGRTPRINARGGRDHFPRAFTMAMAGAGVQGGQVIGATDTGGTTVTDQPVTIPDLFCSFCHALGMDPSVENLSSIGRPVKIVDGGSVIPGLFADAG